MPEKPPPYSPFSPEKPHGFFYFLAVTAATVLFLLVLVVGFVAIMDEVHNGKARQPATLIMVHVPPGKMPVIEKLQLKQRQQCNEIADLIKLANGLQPPDGAFSVTCD